MKKRKDDWITITEAATFCGLTRQSVWKCIKMGLLKAVRESRTWYTTKQWLEDYQAQKYSRLKKKIDGVKLFDFTEGRLTAKQAADLVGLDYQRMYYLLRIGVIPGDKVGGQWLIRSKDIKAHAEQLRFG